MTDKIIMTVEPAKIIRDGSVPYTGEYIVKSSSEEDIILTTENKVCMRDIMVEKFNLQQKIVVPSGSEQEITADNGYDGLESVTVEPIPEINLQTKTVNPDTQQQTYTPDSGYVGFSEFTVEPASLETATATPTVLSQTIEPTAPNIGLSSVTVNPIPPEYIVPIGTITINNNDTYDVTNYANAVVEVVSPEVRLQQKTTTPTTQPQTIIPDQGYDGLSEVIINAAPLQSKAATPTTQQQIIEPDSPNIGLSNVTVNPIPSEYVIPIGTIDINATGIYDVTNYAGASVTLPSDNQTDQIVAGTIQNLSSNALSVGDDVFRSSSSLRTVSLPLATSIGDSSFYSCNNLQSVSAPSVTSIGDHSLFYTHSLTNVSMPALRIIGDYAFADSALTNASFSNAEEIGGYAFYHTTGGYPPNLQSINLPKVNTIKGAAFSYQSNLTNLNFPLLTTISGGSAFFGCSGVTSINMPLLATMSDYTFSGCTSLTHINLPALTEVPSRTVEGCSALTIIDLTAVTNIKTKAFVDANTFSTLILRANSMVTLENVDAFNNTYFSYIDRTATLYVPQALIATYQNDATWNSLLSTAGNQILPIEGSPYEN